MVRKQTGFNGIVWFSASEASILLYLGSLRENFELCIVRRCWLLRCRFSMLSTWLRDSPPSRQHLY